MFFISCLLLFFSLILFLLLFIFFSPVALRSDRCSTFHVPRPGVRGAPPSLFKWGKHPTLPFQGREVLHLRLPIGGSAPPSLSKGGKCSTLLFQGWRMTFPFQARKVAHISLQGGKCPRFPIQGREVLHLHVPRRRNAPRSLPRGTKCSTFLFPRGRGECLTFPLQRQVDCS